MYFLCSCRQPILLQVSLLRLVLQAVSAAGGAPFSQPHLPGMPSRKKSFKWGTSKAIAIASIGGGALLLCLLTCLCCCLHARRMGEVLKKDAPAKDNSVQAIIKRRDEANLPLSRKSVVSTLLLPCTYYHTFSIHC